MKRLLSLCLLAVVEGYLRNLRLLFFGAAFVFAIGLCLRGARLHAGGNLFGEQFEQEIGHFGLAESACLARLPRKVT